MSNKINRRDFLAVMGLAGAGAATMSCSDPKSFEEKWHPWVEPVNNELPYVPRYFATTTPESDGVGLHVKVINGRASKIEGNPEHPINRGRLTARQQSVIQELYGLERVRRPLHNGKEITWKQARELMTEKLASTQSMAALTGPLSGAVHEFWTEFVGRFGNGTLVQYDTFSDSDMIAAGEKAFGRSEIPYFSLKGCDTVVSLGAQFLETWGDVVSNSRDYAAAREVDHGKRIHHYQVEARMSGTGASADEVLYAKPGSETLIALALLKEVSAHGSKLSAAEKGVVDGLTGNFSVEDAATAAGVSAEKIKHLAEALHSAESALVLPAERWVLGRFAAQHYTAVLLLNKALGAIGKHVNYSASKSITQVPAHKNVVDLMESMKAGNIDLLVVKDANPVYSLPSKLNAGEAFDKAGFVVAFADTMNETVAKADLVFPATHALESWGEVHGHKGIEMLQQPVMRPRWEVFQAEDQLIGFIKGADESAALPDQFRDYLKQSWTSRHGGGDKEWREALKLGGVFNMAETGENLPVSGNVSASFFSGIESLTVSDAALVIVTSARYGDGRAANRGWMHELPDQMTGVTWDSWVEMSYDYAEKNNISYGDIVSLQVNGVTVEAPAVLSETQSGDIISVQTGLGHTGLSEANNRGFNAFDLLSGELSDAGTFVAQPVQAKITKAGRSQKVATIHLPGLGDKLNTPQTVVGEKRQLDRTDPHFERNIWQAVAIDALVDHGDGHGGHGGGHHGQPVAEGFPEHVETDFYPDRSKDPVVVGRDETFYTPYKWEMAIDLNKCTGCGSCVTACYAENNLPVVGRDQVVKGREMAWIRVNRYLGYAKDEAGKTEKIYVAFLPMMCQQCANAPCESVCPSLATYHSKEGLNAMVYNRCVGTRYCANNCSYKVRRFNWFTWEWPGDTNWALNPAVSARQKGVMEKCTFCAQRLRDAKDYAKDQGRLVEDGEAVVACQQACPSEAISFGNFSDHNSKVYKLAHDKRAYRALDAHIVTKPGVSYLKRVTLGHGHA